MKNVVIYRSDCEWSKRLLDELTRLPVSRELLFYSADRDPKTKQRNEDLLNILNIQRTPTVYYDVKDTKAERFSNGSKPW